MTVERCLWAVAEAMRLACRHAPIRASNDSMELNLYRSVWSLFIHGSPR